MGNSVWQGNGGAVSVCDCPIVGIDGIEDSKQKQLVAGFLESLAPDGAYAKSGWSLLNLSDMARAGNDVRTISEVVPFRGGPCNRSMRCCGVCTRKCYTRCVQDCLHRLFMWQKTVENTPATEREKLPLNIRLIVNQKFESHAHMSWVVGEILSQSSNNSLKEYMKNESLRPEENPYKIDYAPQVKVDPHTGRRLCNPNTGELIVAEWPQTGLCPFCLPDVTIDGRTAKVNQRRLAAEYR